MNNVDIIEPERMISPTIEGIAINMESLIDLDNVDEYNPDSFF
jgi:hypothetical protein